MRLNLLVRTWRLREKKVGRELKRARPTSFLPYRDLTVASQPQDGRHPGDRSYQIRLISTPG